MTFEVGELAPHELALHRVELAIVVGAHRDRLARQDARTAVTDQMVARHVGIRC